jgi:hypothetical protein
MPGSGTKSTTTSPETTTPENPQISVISQGSRTYSVQGSGFAPNKIVRIRVLDLTTTQNYFTDNRLSWPSAISDSTGKINSTFTLPIPCLGTNISVSATDNTVGPTGQDIYSNIVHPLCQ